jgi:hypothetical protein
MTKAAAADELRERAFRTEHAAPHAPHEHHRHHHERPPHAPERELRQTREIVIDVRRVRRQRQKRRNNHQRKINHDHRPLDGLNDGTVPLHGIAQRL